MTQPTRRRGFPPRPAVDRFWPKVEKTPTCWVWTAGKRHGGYGQFNVGDGRNVRAHVFAYELLVGPVPEGLELDHLCRNPACVNPDHLEPVPHRVNILRGCGPVPENSLKTRCVNGHAYTPQNTYIRPDGYRDCRACKRKRERERQRRLRIHQPPSGDPRGD